MIDSYDITKDVENFINEAKRFINKDCYISTGEYLNFFEKYRDIYVNVSEKKI